MTFVKKRMLALVLVLGLLLAGCGSQGTADGAAAATPAPGADAEPTPQADAETTPDAEAEPTAEPETEPARELHFELTPPAHFEKTEIGGMEMAWMDTETGASITMVSQDVTGIWALFSDEMLQGMLADPLAEQFEGETEISVTGMKKEDFQGYPCYRGGATVTSEELGVTMDIQLLVIEDEKSYLWTFTDVNGLHADAFAECLDTLKITAEEE